MQKIDFNRDWSFRSLKEEKKSNVILPHDAMLREERNGENPSGSAGAYFAGGCYVYEKTFEVPMAWQEKHIVLQFEGVYQTAIIYLNGNEAGKVHYGYGVTEIVADTYLNYGETNSIRVEVDNQNQPNSRWYSGAGLYRPVWLYVMEKGGIALHGIQIRTVSYEPAQIEVKVRHDAGTARITVLDGEREIVQEEGSSVVLEIPDAKLWSDEAPNLYQCKVELMQDGICMDSCVESFGIRKVEWSSKGLFVNGKETLLRGACIHHDNGILGACGYEEAEWRRVRILKENGFNAIRSSHNPCSQAMLEACDALGMYMMDETWDIWFRHKSKYDYADQFKMHYKEDIKSMVEKDFNHPCVILYSIGNEVSEPASKEGIAVEKDMVDYLHGVDAARPVTAGFNLTIIANAAKGQQMYNEDGGLNRESKEQGSGGGMPDMSQMDSTMFNMMAQHIGAGMNHGADSDEADAAITPAVELLDIAGYNYASGRYPMEGEKHPERIVVGTETFPPDIYHNWNMVRQYPYLIGDFMWAGWDYLGEAGIGVWTDSDDGKTFDKPYPWLLGGSGTINILGDPDGEVLYAKTVWGLADAPQLVVRPVSMPEEQTFHSIWRGTNAFPAWSYRGCEGQRAFVEVYGVGDTAELRINGNTKERKKLEEQKAVFETVYEPGIVEVVVYNEAGDETGRDALHSATGELHVEINPEADAVTGKLLYVNINICGENGVIERNADERLEIVVTGGELLGFGSANPRTEESYLDGAYTTYYGRSQAIIRVGEESELGIEVKRREEVTRKIFAVTDR